MGKRVAKAGTAHGKAESEPSEEESANRPTCGLVMPISSIDGLPADHWRDVKSILSEAIHSAGMVARLVSDDIDAGLIHGRIVSNLYSDELIVCDVSAKNPNVMFELGMRLAFDKPTIVVKDNLTSYSFDTSPIEHIEYPRDLRFASILEFQEKLKIKIQNNREGRSKNSFLKNFGPIRVANVEPQEMSEFEAISARLTEMESRIFSMLRPFQRRIYSEHPQMGGGYSERLMRDKKPAVTHLDNLLRLSSVDANVAAQIMNDYVHREGWRTHYKDGSLYLIAPVGTSASEMEMIESEISSKYLP